MQVTRLAPEHASQYRDLMLHGYEHEPDAFTSTPEERAAMPLSWWANRAADPEGKGIAFGAFSGERLVGTVALEFSSKPKTRHKAHLIGMYVMETWRGQGIGRQLVSAAIAHVLASPGISVLTLTVTEGNQSAVALYESAGFRAFGVEPMAILTPGGYKGKIHMWREVVGGNAVA
jgi:ribosomal protein S18 acetylase RimI-like enzyme